MGALAGTPGLLRLILRRDRIRIPVWVVATVGFVLSSVAGLPGIYPTRADRQARAELMDNPMAVVITGPGYGLDDYTFGALTAHEMFGFTAIVVALMSVLLVVRHTRAEEEAGRAELVAYAVLVGMLGGLLQLPRWAHQLSPFGHLPQLPAEDPAAAPLLVVTMVAAALVAAGLAGLRHRDLA